MLVISANIRVCKTEFLIVINIYIAIMESALPLNSTIDTADGQKPFFFI